MSWVSYIPACLRIVLSYQVVTRSHSKAHKVSPASINIILKTPLENYTRSATTASTMADDYYASFSAFDYNPTTLLIEELCRLALRNQWKDGNKICRSERQKCLGSAFDYYFSSIDRSRAHQGWQVLCKYVAIDSLPFQSASFDESVHVAVCDPQTRPKVYRNFHEFSSTWSISSKLGGSALSHRYFYPRVLCDAIRSRRERSSARRK